MLNDENTSLSERCSTAIPMVLRGPNTHEGTEDDPEHREHSTPSAAAPASVEVRNTESDRGQTDRGPDQADPRRRGKRQQDERQCAYAEQE
ncbi:hypothetical protein ACH3VR_03905 [Microbacterium sp. B2969]|uniref:Uncharacterized protein n=1 Tax=Microbacterium alkaliflavum TaxID=3248839 RepID=A0ABW7Q4C8_9MICO